MADQASRLTSGKASGKAPGFRQTPEARGPSLSERQQNLSECHCAARRGGILGYARVSTTEQDASGQKDRLADAGAIRVFTDIASGARAKRPALAELIDHVRPGDILCVTRLDRLGRSLKELPEIVEGLKERGIHLASLEEDVDTSSAAGEPVFHVF